MSAACGAAAIAVLAALHAGAEERALRRLPVDERAALYQRAMENLTSICASEEKRALRDFCHDQAQLALMLPECDLRCERLAREQLRTPTR